MSGTKLMTATVLLLLCWNTHQASAQFIVSIVVDYTPPPGFTPGPNEYRAASGPVKVTCTATGTNPDTYQWTSDCKNCPFQVQIMNDVSTMRTITRAAVSSNDGGTHTCTATRPGGEMASASIVFNIVGAGIQVLASSAPKGSQPNNGLIRSTSPASNGTRRLRFVCRSNSTAQNVGELIGLDGTAITNSSFFDIDNSQPGDLNVNNRVGFQDPLTADEQGVYTCRIPLESKGMREINIGIYHFGFTSADGPNITNPLVFTAGSPSSNLTCTSTGSPATTVNFTRDGTTVGPLRDGESVTINGVIYQLAQTVTNRRMSTYENVLTITEMQSSLIGSSFTCYVKNALGMRSSKVFEIPGPLTVSITVDRTDPPGFTLGDSTEYRAASGPQVITCTAKGGAGEGPTYQWSSDCRNCPFQKENSESERRMITRPALHSGDTGTHTCTVMRGGENASGSIVFNIVGAGVHVFDGHDPKGSQPNNGLARPLDTTMPNARRLRFFCRSDSMMQKVGKLIGLNESVITSSRFFNLTTPQCGELQVLSTVGPQDPLTASQQGVYTCRIPLQSGEMKEINIGIYPFRFTSVPTITNLLVFTPGSSSSNLTCTSTTSVATTVTFMRDSTTVGPLRDGESMEFGGVSYQLEQTVTSRAQSTYQNMLTITEERSSLVDSSFTCQVENVLGMSETSQPFVIPAALTVNITVSYTPPPGFTPGPNEYREASGPVVVTCTATGGAGHEDYLYEWTSTCANCEFQMSSLSGETIIINQTAVHSDDTGTHTCTASRGGESESDSIVFIVVGGRGRSSGGAIAGGIIGAIIVIVLIVLIIILVVWLWRRSEDVGKPYALPPSVRENTAGQESIRYTRATDEVTTTKKTTSFVPVIQEFPDNDVTFLEGEGLSFAIHVTGVPTPSTVWYQDGKELVSDYSLEIAGDGSLTIPSVEPRHSGTYKLVVANQAGSMDKTVKVSVLSEVEATPSAPQQQQLDITAIPVAEFGKYVATNHSNNNRGFQDLYGALYSGDERPVALAKSAKNKPLNRFTNITVYDDHRILLQPLPGHSDCQRDYVNASYIDGYSIPKKFIATQGPLPKTNVDFWRLVWQERPPSIVMVTNLREGNKIKCQQYWPESGNKKFGPFQITITNQQTFADYIIRTFSVSLSGSSERPLKVTQYHFMAWPDHGVPEYATPILTFHRRVISQHIPSRGPLLVHCSAGIGRTGTFITIDCVLEQLQREHVIDIFSTINRIRQQRMKLVQTAVQFSFVHDAVLESVTCGDTQNAANNFRSAIRNLGGRNPQTRQSGFESQFQVLHQVSPKPDEVRREAAIHHRDMNRSMDYLPPDRYRVVLKGEVPDYIHAISANGYKQQKAFIIAENPLESSCRNFWKMLYSRKCAAIVMLSRLVENRQEVCYQYWPMSGVKQFGEFTVDLLGEEKLEGFVLRTFSVLDTKSGKAHRITQFHIVNWTPDGHCSNLKTVTDIIEEVGKVQRKTGNHPVAIHCSDTVCRSGMFCSIATTIERCKTEGVVDVFQVVKALRVQKPGAVLTVAQYQQVFEAVLVYLESFDTYANFQNI